MTTPPNRRPFLPHPAIGLAFLVSATYWLYLLFFSGMMLDSDAKAYYNLGVLLRDQGWAGYFTSGPNREPLYPLLISWALRLADSLSLPFEDVQAFFQIVLLGASQIFLNYLMTRLMVRPLVRAPILLYFGLSPAIVNSGFSLFSEIATYPFILGAVFWAARSWSDIRQAGRGRILADGLALGLCLLGLVFIKGIFELITPLFLAAFLVFGIRLAFLKKFSQAGRALAVFLLAATIFIVPVTRYKAANERANGNFTLTNRGSWALFGNTVRRLRAWEPAHYLTAFSFVPGENICYSLFGRDRCLFWAAATSDEIAKGMIKDWDELGIPAKEQDKLFLKFTLAEVAENPVKYAFFVGVESLKMLFWESTKVGWVDYPEGLQKVFDQKLFNNALRLLAAVLTAWGLFFGYSWVSRYRPVLFGTGGVSFSNSLIFLSMHLIICYTLAHALFFVLTRYVFPLVPLYLILIAYAVQNTLPPEELKSTASAPARKS